MIWRMAVDSAVNGRAAICCAMLAGCAAPVVLPPTPAPSMVRNPTANIGSQVDVKAADLAGDWVVRQAVAGVWPDRMAPDGIVTVRFTATGDTLGLVRPVQACDGVACDAADQTVLFQAGAAGRWDHGGRPAHGLPREIWVYWMDFDDRTVALGDPNGNFVAILDRSNTGGADRITAAREILDWYGYDLMKLIKVAQ